MGLRRQRTRYIGIGNDTFPDQNIDNFLAVRTRTRALDLFPGNESHLFEDFEHVIFVVLHRDKDA